MTDLPKITSHFLEKHFRRISETIIAFSPLPLATRCERHPWAYVGEAVAEIASLSHVKRQRRIPLHFCHASSQTSTIAQPPP